MNWGSVSGITTEKPRNLRGVSYHLSSPSLFFSVLNWMLLFGYFEDYPQ